MTKLLAWTTMVVTCVLAWPAYAGQAVNAEARDSTASWNFWQSFKEWEALTAETPGTPETDAKAGRILDQLIQNVYLVKFAPAEEFNPQTPGEILRVFGETSSLRSAKDRLGGASFFRTKRENNKLMASFLTEHPEQMKQDIGRNPKIVFVSMEEATPEKFIAHVKSAQEALQAAPTRKSFPAAGNSGKYMACENHGGAGFHLLDTATGKLWWSDMASEKLGWKYFGQPPDAPAGGIGTYLAYPNKSGGGLFVLNTMTGAGWWTDGKAWKALGKPE